jgi:fermentation-respiration switch protein FrsA (DUF1100 family)
VLFVSEQLDDYRTVLAWCKKQDALDPARVVVWGTSFAGGHAITLAQEPRLRLAAAIAQCPYAGGPPLVWSAGLLATIAWGLLDTLLQALGRGPVYVPTAARPGEVGLLTVPGWAEDMWALAEDRRCVGLGLCTWLSASDTRSATFRTPCACAPARPAATHTR